MGNEPSNRSKNGPSSSSKKDGPAACLQKVLPSSLKLGSGQFSSSAIRRLLEQAKKSRTLQLKGAGIKSIPPNVVEELHSALRILALSGNKIRELPPSIGTFSMLKQLYIANNRLTSLPDEIGCLKTLELLDAAGNQLTELPDSLAACNSLTQVNVSSNKLSKFPAVLTRLLRLEVLDLSENAISALPDELLFSIAMLRATELIMRRNQLTSLNAAHLTKCEQLKIIRLDENCLPKEAFTAELLEQSALTLITHEGNLFAEKEFQALPGYDAYEQRFTATRRRLF
uniref:Leucine-rich repeat-containing protein 57 n=1 Tax=Globodera pallida TaxID=36090 RepID=A0A183C253_GLOPA